MKLSFAFLIFLAALWTLSSVAEDIVEMKNGDVYRGTIVQQKMNSYIQIRFRDGNEKRIKWAGIQDIKKGAEREKSSTSESFFNNPQYLEMDKTAQFEIVMSMSKARLDFSGTEHFLDLEAQVFYMPFHHLQGGIAAKWAHWRQNNANASIPLSILAEATFNYPFETPLKDSFFATGGIGISDCGSTEFAFGMWVGKRFAILDRLSYRPSFGIFKVNTKSLYFQFMPIVVSLIL